ncbi:DNA-binding MurR/RpiR family transcriptional regulator [Actinoplanes lutulentus]|uniref:RpiR family transcriptional regulator n=1 Tax=Actinoplanes lutulentus TaxID=1287878 RepID=A0A327Z300_9ACTN|nr:MurR/RpiR family transcriptional regulator [Actinoplanes lutulentus]MBB2943789.1 DNA-binding MurR/RpiR family transcriptional regulator [Actinoplanes lutulentus]RAK29331.1 RpiR family transcriptional regulator [Actinoplanes lutulentus]
MAPEDWLLNLAQQHRLSPTQRQIVQRMLGMFPGVAFLSTVEIAEQTGVSQPTVTRLATALGFAGFPEFRTALREAVLSGVPEQRGPGQRAPERFDAGVVAIEQECANVGSLHRVVTGDRMAAAVRLLAASQPLGVVGLRASAALAEHFGFFARRILPSVTTCTNAGTLADTVLQLRQQDASALLIFAMPRYPAATVAAIRRARKLGLSTVVIADSALAPFAGEADVLLVAPVGTGLVFDSHAAAVVLSISLLDAIAATDPERTQRRLEAHESLVDDWIHEA